MTGTILVDEKADSSFEKLERRVTTLRWVVIVLAVVAVALGAWIIYDLSQERALAPTAEISELVDTYTAAWNDYDGDAFLATTREGYLFTSTESSQVTDREEQYAVIEDVLPAWAWEVEMLDEPVVVGDGPWYYASFPVEIDTNLFGTARGMSVLTIFQDGDGSFLVTDHAYVGR